MSISEKARETDKDNSNAVVEEITSSRDESPSFGLDKEMELLTPEKRRIAERALVRRLDLRLLPTIWVIFILNYIDRTAVTTARLQGLEQDLKLTDIQYSAVLAILYASYCPAQIPSNMILNYVSRPSLYIGFCVVAWGLTSCLTGITKNYAGIMTCRVFIGLPEAAFYPGSLYLLSRWYTKKELAFRSAFLYSGLLISNAFGNLLAAGILSGLNEKLGIRGWRWLFYIEGAVTICVGFMTMWSLPDYPPNTRWLSPAERRLAQVRLAEDAGEADEDGAGDSILNGLVLALKDPKVYILGAMTSFQLLGLSFINFFPTLTSTLGFGTTYSLLLAAPPWVVASVVCCLNARSADRTGERFFHITAWWWGVMLGYIIGVSTMSLPGRYVSMFLMACGYSGFALTLVWTSNAVPRPPAKRAVAMGIVNGFGNIGNLVGSFVWKSSWGPDYHQSMYIGIGALAVSTLLSLVLRYLLIHQNKQIAKDEMALGEGDSRARIEEAARLEGITFEEALKRRRGFRYLY